MPGIQKISLAAWYELRVIWIVKWTIIHEINDNRTCLVFIAIAEALIDHFVSFVLCTQFR
jgi:hypothetical protein